MSEQKREQTAVFGNVIPTNITTAVVGNIGYLTLLNASKFNALPQSGWEAVPFAVNRLMKDGARVIVVRGDGGNFCAGADISEFDTVRKNADTARLYEKTNADAFFALRTASVPTIACIRGYCLGGGFGLAAACDLRMSDETGLFAVPAARLGLGYPVDAMADIVNAVGVQTAKQMLFTARRYSADDMLKCGFLSDIVAADHLDNRATALAEEIAALAPLTHKATKAAIAAALGGNRDMAQQAGDATFASQDYAEGRLAFREKRSPEFKGW
jgi:enoyl-CoA hydratase/carnithine racemase